MSAVRLARGATGRDRVIKFDGCYHGHSDGLLAGGGSGVAMLGLPGSAGVSAGAVADTEVVPYNVVPELDDGVACVIVEPVAANMNLVPPLPGFLEGLRAACTRQRCPPHLRRGHHRFPARAGGSDRLVRRDAGPLVLRQGDRRRAAGGRVRRAARSAGRAGAGRSRLPSGHAVGKPPRHGGGVGGAGPCAAGRLRGAVGARRAVRRRTSSRRSPPVAWPSWRRSWARWSGSSWRRPTRRRSRRPLTTKAARPIAGGDTYARFFHAMLRRGVALAPGAYEVMFPGMAHDEDVLARVVEAAGEAAAEVSG